MLRMSLIAALLAVMGTTGFEQEAFRADLDVEISYQGATPVDEAHRLYVFVFDTPDFAQGARPIGMGTTDTNGATIKVVGLSTSPVYVAAAFDETGNYNPTAGPPPSGTPVGLYQSAGQPAPVELSADSPTVIELSLNESNRMP